MLEHKWFLSERARRDVGLEASLDDYVQLRRQQPAVALVPPVPSSGS